MKKNIRLAFIIFIIILVSPIKVLGFYTDSLIQKVEYTDQYKEWEKLSDEEKQKTIMPKKYEISIPKINYYSRENNSQKSLLAAKLMISNYDKYNLREHININVRNQEQTGLCWALATNSIIESNIEMLTKNKSPLFSARYAEYATSKTFSDGKNQIAYDREVGNGGYAEIALGLYTSGKGPVLEADMPFENNENQISLSSIQGIEVQKKIEDYVRFPGIYKEYNSGVVNYTDAHGNAYTSDEVSEIRNQIKEHIIQYGAVVSETYGVGGLSQNARKYYNNQNDIMRSNAYFCNHELEDEKPDHQIAIIGWDDNYAVSNFNKNYEPSTPGAYIVLNSWGEEFGESGVYYISYEDYYIEQNILGIVSTSDINYDNIYQYDELGNNYAIGLSGDAYGANVFQREISTETELLTEISVSCLVDTKCEIYVNAEDGELSASKLKKVADNLSLQNGYHTIKLDKPIELTGSEFVVVVKYLANESGISYFELEYPDGNYWNTASAEKGQSFLSSNLEDWDDIMDLASVTIIPTNANLCIKAFTEYREENKYFTLNKYNMDSEYIFNISPKTKINELINNISTNMEYYIYDKDNQFVDEEDTISTGMELKNEEGTYKIVVKGDVNGDGKISITDVVKVKLHTINIRKLSAESFKAGDINGDDKITITDLVNVNLASLNIKKL